MQSTAVRPLDAESALPFSGEDACEAPRVIYLPRPMSHNPAVIAQGRETALARYREAKTNAQRMAALLWVNHWRRRHEHVTALKPLRLVD